MGDDTISMHGTSEAQSMADLEAEFQRELERNQAAVRLMQQRAEEAQLAKEKAEQSQKRMEDMKNYFTQMHSKLEASRKNLHAAQDRIERQNRIQATVNSLKERANMYADKLSKQRMSAALGADISDFDFPQPLIDYKAEEEKERQQQQIEVSALQVSDLENELQRRPASAKIDYARTVLDLQEKLSRVKAAVVPAAASTSPLSSSSSPSSASAQTTTDAHADQDVDEPDEPEDILAIDLNESVQRLEAKCAGVREELGRMALSEQYMRTKQAQLRAKRKEMEAKEAMLRAELREKEAAEMREKVGTMMRLLSERKNKLKSTEDVIHKKGDVVEKVNKILDRKERRATYVTKQRDEQLAFGKQAKK